MLLKQEFKLKNGRIIGIERVEDYIDISVFNNETKISFTLDEFKEFRDIIINSKFIFSKENN